MLYKMPIHVLVCKVGRKTCFIISISAVILKLMVKIIHFRLIQVLKNSMA